MIRPIRWGILGSGAVAHGFAEGLRALPDAQLVAVASGTLANAQRFAQRFSVPRVHQTYADLARDPSLDVIYVATPHQRHLEDGLLCIEHGKPVLCEKPFTVNARQARELVGAARRHRVFCMEAMWMRCIPAVRKLAELIADGAIGDLHMIQASFGVASAFDPRKRQFDPHQAGGSLLDLGVYPVSLAFLVLGAPERVISSATIGASGVDEQAAIVFSYPEGQLAVLSTSLRSWASQEAVIMGSKGRIRVHAPFYCPSTLTLTLADAGEQSAAPGGGMGAKDRLIAQIKGNRRLRPLARKGRELFMRLAGRSPQTIKLPLQGNGYNYEAGEVMCCLRAGLLESPLVPLDETVRIVETMDAIRAQWPLTYPVE
jgi:predicted dehydrogenase